jgi:hypothetical protein
MLPINGNILIYDAIFVSEAFQRTIETFGTLDIVINNAGILNDVEWEKEVDINLVSRHYLYCMHICKVGCLRAQGQRVPIPVAAPSAVVRLRRLWVRIPEGARMFVSCECLCVFRLSSLRRTDHSSREVLPSVGCPIVI